MCIQNNPASQYSLAISSQLYLNVQRCYDQKIGNFNAEPLTEPNKLVVKIFASYQLLKNNCLILSIVIYKICKCNKPIKIVCSFLANLKNEII